MKLLNFLLIICLTSSCITKEKPFITSTGNSIEDFVPKNWKILRKVEGDLNNDKQYDIALIIQATDSTKTEVVFGEEGETLTNDYNNRILLVLIKDTINNRFNLKGQSKSFIINRNSSNQIDPLQEVKISNNTLKISFFLWYSANTG